MRRKRAAPRLDPVEVAIRAAGSIGALERLAGIGPTLDERAAFWNPFMTLPAAAGLDAGVAELKRRIRAAAVSRSARRAVR